MYALVSSAMVILWWTVTGAKAAMKKPAITCRWGEK